MRPNGSQSRELNALEGITASAAAIDLALDRLGLRHRQAMRRALGNPRLLDLLEPMGEELQEIREAAEAIRRAILPVLATRQEQRSRGCKEKNHKEAR